MDTSEQMFEQRTQANYSVVGMIGHKHNARVCIYSQVTWTERLDLSRPL